VVAILDDGDVDVETSPFFSTLSPGMPWQITSLTEVQMALG
jgi:hypothetical protein